MSKRTKRIARDAAKAARVHGATAGQIAVIIRTDRGRRALHPSCPLRRYSKGASKARQGATADAYIARPAILAPIRENRREPLRRFGTI